MSETTKLIDQLLEKGPMLIDVISRHEDEIADLTRALDLQRDIIAKMYNSTALNLRSIKALTRIVEELEQRYNEDHA